MKAQLGVTAVLRLTGGLVVLAATCASGQTGILDQSSPFAIDRASSASTFLRTTFTWQQQVQCGISGMLEGVRLRISGSSGARFRLRIRYGPAWSAATVVATAEVTKAAAGNEYVFVNLSSHQVLLAAGQTFVIETTGLSTASVGVIGSHVSPADGWPLYSGPLYFRGLQFLDGGWRQGFETYILPSPLACIADSNADGGIDGADISAYFELWSAADLRADVNADGGVDGSDAQYFVEAWSAASCR